jgi:hypothetical protein
MQFRETFAVYCENHTEHTKTLCEQNAEFEYEKGSGTYGKNRDLKGYLSIIPERPEVVRDSNYVAFS